MQFVHWKLLDGVCEYVWHHTKRSHTTCPVTPPGGLSPARRASAVTNCLYNATQIMWGTVSFVRNRSSSVVCSLYAYIPPSACILTKKRPICCLPHDEDLSNLHTFVSELYYTISTLVCYSIGIIKLLSKGSWVLEADPSSDDVYWITIIEKKISH